MDYNVIITKIIIIFIIDVDVLEAMISGNTPIKSFLEANTAQNGATAGFSFPQFIPRIDFHDILIQN